jgi:hypothetical protein
MAARPILQRVKLPTLIGRLKHTGRAVAVQLYVRRREVGRLRRTGSMTCRASLSGDAAINAAPSKLTAPGHLSL